MLRNIGEMKHRITFQRNLNSEPDEKGYPQNEWSDFCSVWAHREDVSGKEFFNAAAINEEEVMTFIIHWKNGLTNSMRILHRDEVFDIIHIGGGRNVGDFLTVRAKRIQKSNSKNSENGDCIGKSKF